MMATAIQGFSFPCNLRNPSLTHLSLSSPSSFSPIKFPTLRSLCFSSHLPHSLLPNGCLSTSTIIRRPKRLSVICMARRYGSNTRKRLIKSRRRGGDLEKKRKRRRKIARTKKDKVKTVRLISAVGTGYVYTKIKGKKISKKLEIKKYDPQVQHHVLFNEAK